MAGVSLAAIQALYRQISELAAQNKQLIERLSGLEAELAVVKGNTADTSESIPGGRLQ